jgi:putative hemolysin
LGLSAAVFAAFSCVAFAAGDFMGPARRAKFRFRIAARRWGLPVRRPRFGRRPSLPDNVAALAPLYEAAKTAECVWPVLAEHGPLQVRIATTKFEIKAAQRLRYHVFYDEMSAIPTRRMRIQTRDFDKYDRFCHHMLVVDRDSRGEFGEPAVVGTYRLLRSDVAATRGGYYTSSEYDLSSVMVQNGPGMRYLELGRSCVLKSYRCKPITMQLLWKGIVAYVDRYRIDVMFGCGSLPGTDPEALKLPLSYLYHFHRTTESQFLRARPERFVSMNRMPKDAIDPKAAMRKLPPLIKGYLRAGAVIGDGAVIDRQFGTTDVLIYFPVSKIGSRYRSKFTAGA